MGARDFDVVLIGGGHNGLVCACYLAAAGLKVVVFERRGVLGGAAVTEEFHPGFRNSVASYTVSLLHPKVIRELRLAEHGLRILERPMANFLPLPDGDFLRVGGGLEATQSEFRRFSRRDADRLPAYNEMLESVADLLRALLLETPPRFGQGGITDVLRTLKLGRHLRRLSMKQRRDVLALFTKSAAEVLEGWFEAEPVRAAFAFDGIVGNFASPCSPGTAYVLLHHVMGEVNGKRGNWGHAVGGMGSITRAMASEAERLGVECLTSSPVSKVVVEGGAAAGVELADGMRVGARAVVANVNPKLLYLEMMRAEDLDPEFLDRIRGWRCGSASLRMNVALSELPRFDCLPAPGPHHGAGIVIAPSVDYMERAYFDARLHGWSEHPVIELLIPSTVDGSLAPEGAHVASLFCQHFNPKLPDYESWDRVREAVADHVIETVNRYAPNFKASILGRMTLTPLDLEREFGLVGGDIFHGALGLDQLYSARPVLGYGDYRAPCRGLYLCGSGTHPGGGVTGIPGHNAAREILRDLRRR